jgi:hypothetical protein
MPSIYEALMRASEEREALKSKRSMPGSKGAVAAHLPYRMEDEMLVLLEAIESILPQSRKRSIQFIGSQTGQGASNMAREYARFSASATGLSVLLIEPGKPSAGLAPPEPPIQKRYLCPNPAGDDPPEALFHQVEGLNLFVSHSANAALRDSLSPDRQSNQLLWTLLKDRFDLMVIDASSAAHSPENPALVPRVDGVVLVLESEMTWPGAHSGAEGLGLASVLAVVAKGLLTPQQVVTCLGLPVLILTPMSA